MSELSVARPTWHRAIETLQQSKGTAMQYALLFYQSPDEFAARADPKKREAFWASFIPYMKALHRRRHRRRRRRPGAARRRDLDQADRRQAASAGRPVRRSQGAARRLLHHRRGQSRRRRSNGPPAIRPGRAGGVEVRPVLPPDGPREDVECGWPRGRRRSRRTIVPDGRVSEAVEQAARRSYGRLLAFLAARSRDVTAAEDCLADAFHAALTTWPRDGRP